MTFKNDKQRKAVMMRLKQPRIRKFNLKLEISRVKNPKAKSIENKIVFADSRKEAVSITKRQFLRRDLKVKVIND